MAKQNIKETESLLISSVSESSRIGVLGGTFDPIHNGHKALGEAAIKEAQLSRLVVMPARIQPFKLNKQVTQDYHRLAMTRLAFEGNDKVEVSDYEINNTDISYTYDTLMYLKNFYPKEEIFFVMGTDSYLQLEKWYKGKKILRNFSFIVSSRPGYKEEELAGTIKLYGQRYGADTIKLRSEMPDISSTKLRKILKERKPVNQLIPDAVERYIKENGLYY